MKSTELNGKSIASSNGPQKEWYKTWWGIILAIFFLPIFGIWFIWSKTKMNKNLKWVLTGLILIITICLLGSNGGSTPTTDKTTTPPPKVDEKTKAATVFDVPALFGKNIDEVRIALGAPDDKKSGMDEPNAQQLALGVTTWDNTFTKGKYSININFNPVSRAVIDYFLSDDSSNGSDKALLLEIGNLSESDSKYTIKAVKMIKDPSKITGIIVTPNN